MKNIRISSVEATIIHNGHTYELFHTADVTIASQLQKAAGAHCLLATLPLHRNLRGKTDLHGKPYQPTKWLYTRKS